MDGLVTMRVMDRDTNLALLKLAKHTACTWCKAGEGEQCLYPSGRLMKIPHQRRLAPLIGAYSLGYLQGRADMARQAQLSRLAKDTSTH